MQKKKNQSKSKIEIKGINNEIWVNLHYDSVYAEHNADRENAHQRYDNVVEVLHHLGTGSSRRTVQLECNQRED